VFLGFFLALRKARVPVTLREYLTLLEAMEAGIPEHGVERFYYLARACLVKDERNIDKFDRVFAETFRGVDHAESELDALIGAIPEDWLRKLAEKNLTDDEKRLIESLGGFEAVMQRLREQLAKQTKRHQGGSKAIGTAGTSPFGAHGYNPEGVRIGQDESRHRRAVKVWDRREFRNLDDNGALGERNIKLALRRLRRFAREGAATELDLPDTVRSTASKAGLLDIRMVPERHNAVKVLLLLDIGGSMDDHVRVCESLFAAARSEFKHLEHYYFHNCPYERLWRDNRRRESGDATIDVIRTYPPDWKLILVGDAAMAQSEIALPGGSVEHWNEEPGAVWLERLLRQFPRAAWINPSPESQWSYTGSIGLIGRLMGGRMHPLSPAGIDAAARELSR
jgi:uncharacterized protein with von Willebrand factor type A (vWA) domain